MREKKELDDLECAAICFFGIYDCHYFDDLVSDKAVNPETAAIKQDLYEKLSEEAKEVIGIILESPAEFAEFCIAPKTGKYKRKKDDKTYFIKMYFRRVWGSRLKVRSVFAEIESYLQKINS